MDAKTLAYASIVRSVFQGPLNPFSHFSPSAENHGMLIRFFAIDNLSNILIRYNNILINLSVRKYFNILYYESLFSNSIYEY